MKTITNIDEKSMEIKEKQYSISMIASLLGVNDASIERWIESGKLNCTVSAEGKKLITRGQLVEFSERYNVSIKLLEQGTYKKSMFTSSVYNKKTSAQ